MTPIKEKALRAENLRCTLHHDRQNLDTCLFGKGKRTLLEALNFAIFGARTLWEHRNRNASRNPQLTIVDNLTHRLCSSASVDSNIAVEIEELTNIRHTEHLALADPTEGHRH